MSDVLVIFDYSIIEKTELRTHNVYGQTGTSSTSTYGTLNTYNNNSTYSETTYSTPTYGVVGTSTNTETVYVRNLRLNIYEFNNTPLYEGKVVSEGSSSQLNIIMKYLVEALFKNFPGENGETEYITIPMVEK
ncbi:DUF4136 domain-containing protein (plasmid) [Fusobacteria bacterium ZRK30]|nr:DUF4136 domain-containing protein [Fusobacteria bacterium ZRK30]